MGTKGKALTIPRTGEHCNPNSLYVMRVRYGYGTTDRSTGGASDGIHVWSDTQATSTLVTIPAISSDYTTDGLTYKGVIVYDLYTIVKEDFSSSVTLCIGDCADSDGWAVSTDIAPTSTGVSMAASSALNKPAYGMLGKRAVVYGSTTADRIKITSGGADVGQGILDVYIVYSYVDSQQLANTDWPSS